MNKLIVAIAIAILIGVVIGGIFILNREGNGLTKEPGSSKVSSSAVFTVGQPAPNFTLKDFEGREVNLSDFYGKKAVLIDFWAAWCPFCISEMPELEKAHKTYGEDLVVIGVHRTDSGESISTGKKFAQEQGVTYLLAQGTSEIYRASTKGIQAMPVAVFIDKNGMVLDIKLGPKTTEEIQEKVEKLLK